MGKLTSIDRYLKVKRYLDKRQKRIWMKKVSYSTRKDYAEKRIRIKGRFINKEDQKEILERIFADEQITETNVRTLNRNLHDLVNSPNQVDHLLNKTEDFTDARAGKKDTPKSPTANRQKPPHKGERQDKLEEAKEEVPEPKNKAADK